MYDIYSKYVNTRKRILETKNIGTKIAFNDYKRIMKLVESGFFVNSSDFLREAIRYKLKEYNIRNKRFSQEEQNFDINIIADELKLDIFVNNIAEELNDEGIIKEDR